MNKIEQLIEKAYKNNKVVSISDVLNLGLSNSDYEILIYNLEKNGIEVKEEVFEENEYKDEDYRVCNSVRQYLNEISKIPLLTKEEEKNFFTEYNKSHDPKLREKLITSNLRLVVNIAKEYSWAIKNNINDLLDLIQEGNKGLMIAVERFDVTFEKRFSSYATWWIRQSIGKTITEMNGSIRLPLSLAESYKKIKRRQQELQRDTGDDISEMDAALSLGIKRSRAEDVIKKGALCIVSLDEKPKEDSNKSKIELIQNGERPLEDEMIENFEINTLLKIMKERLSEKEFFIISYRLGFVNEVNSVPGFKTLEEVGDKVHLTRERIRQILKEIYIKIKREYKKMSEEKTKNNNNCKKM